MSDTPNCTKCGCEFTYENQGYIVCPECGHEWLQGSELDIDIESTVKDAHGNTLKDGDDITIIKDLKVKGASSSIKVGTKAKNIRLIDEVDGHNIEAKVPGFGLMRLKSQIVKKSK